MPVQPVRSSPKPFEAICKALGPETNRSAERRWQTGPPERRSQPACEEQFNSDRQVLSPHRRALFFDTPSEFSHRARALPYFVSRENEQNTGCSLPRPALCRRDVDSGSDFHRFNKSETMFPKNQKIMKRVEKYYELRFTFTRNGCVCWLYGDLSYPRSSRIQVSTEPLLPTHRRIHSHVALHLRTSRRRSQNLEIFRAGVLGQGRRVTPRAPQGPQLAGAAGRD